MFVRYTGIGVGHDTMQLRRYAHGLVQVDDHLAADSKEEGGEASVEESPCGQLEALSQNVLQFVSFIMVPFSFPSYIVLICSLVCSHTIGYIF